MLVDLSQDIYEGMQVYPGHSKTVTFEHASHAETAPRFDSDFSFQTTGLLLNDNGPTHVDSFSHLDPTPGAQTIDEMDLDLFYGPAVCVDVSAVPPGTDITVADIEGAIDTAGVEVRPGDIVLFHTGTHARHSGTPAYLSEHAGFGQEASQWIADHGIKTFGVDAPTPDNPTSRTYPCHLMCRHNHITHYENLTNLDKVLGKRFTFIGFPLKVIGAHGGPTRAVALLDD